MSEDGWKKASLRDLAKLMKQPESQQVPTAAAKPSEDSSEHHETGRGTKPPKAPGDQSMEALVGRGLLKLKRPSTRVPIEAPTPVVPPLHSKAPKEWNPSKAQAAAAIPKPATVPNLAPGSGTPPSSPAKNSGFIVRDVPLPAPAARNRDQAPAAPLKVEPSEKVARCRLDDASAEVGRLRIRMPPQTRPMLKLAEPKKVHNPAFFQKLKRFARQAPLKLEPSPAIIGFDFGTAFTKVVIQWRARHYAVPWRDGDDDCQRFLLPSIVFVGSDGCASLDRGKRAITSLIDGIKGRLLTLSEAELASNPEAAVDAVLFMASALRHAMAWFKGIATSQGGDVSTWRLNIGLPAEPWQDEPLREGLRRIGAAALVIAEDVVDITRASSRHALQEAGAASQPVAVVAEFAAQLASYMKGPQRQNDLHMLIDVGAGTVDLVAFNSHVTEDAELLPLAGAAVERLGAHYLLATLAGRPGQDREWEDSNSTESDGYFARHNREDSTDVAQRRDAFHRVFRFAMGRLGNEAHQWYPQSEKFRAATKSRIPVFLCGGGSHIEQFRDMVLTYTGFRVELRPLPMPGVIEGFSDEAAFHRLSVAYGLSLNSRNLAQVWRREVDSTIRQRREIDFGDRDADR